MDPLTQGVFGAVAGQLVADKKYLGKASLVGALSGMSPDLDVLIRSANDPLLALEYHRHFTHSLLFVPIGGFICGLFFYVLLGKRWRISLPFFIIWSTLGFATHGLLDACTSYGTRLLWPFSDMRIAWDLVSVIDPLFSGILFALTVSAIVWRNKTLPLFSVGWIAVYLMLASVQHQRALHWAEEIALNRGHTIDELHAKPSFGNIVVWKSIYQSGDTYYVDAIKPGLFAIESWEGDRIRVLNLFRDIPWLLPNSQQAKDIERFRHFSAGFIALDPKNSNRIGDIRYSQLPHKINPLWGIELSPTAATNQHARYVTQRSGSREALPELIEMILE